MMCPFGDAQRASSNRIGVTLTELRHNRVVREVGASPLGNCRASAPHDAQGM
jgi:hypothetical protein